MSIPCYALVILVIRQLAEHPESDEPLDSGQARMTALRKVSEYTMFKTAQIIFFTREMIAEASISSYARSCPGSAEQGVFFTASL